MLQFSNNAATTLATSITNVATSLTVSTGAGALFPTLTATNSFYCSLTNTTGANEIVLVSARTGDVFTIARGQDGTTALAWNAGDKVELRLVKAVLSDLYARGATGAGADAVFFENGQVVTTNYTITAGKNAVSAGPITINTGVTVTVPTGSTWVIV